MILKLRDISIEGEMSQLSVNMKIIGVVGAVWMLFNIFYIDNFGVGGDGFRLYIACLSFWTLFAFVTNYGLEGKNENPDSHLILVSALWGMHAFGAFIDAGQKGFLTFDALQIWLPTFMLAASTVFFYYFHDEKND